MDQNQLQLSRCIGLYQSAHVAAALDIAFRLGVVSQEIDAPEEMHDFADLRDAWELGQLHAMDEAAFSAGYQMPHADEVPSQFNSPSLAGQFRAGQQSRRRSRESRVAAVDVRMDRRRLHAA